MNRPFTPKTVNKKGSKTEIDVPANSIYGATTAPGLYTVTVKLTNVTMKKGVEKTFTIEVEPLPNWVACTFNGGGYFGDIDIDDDERERVRNIRPSSGPTSTAQRTVSLRTEGLPER